MHRPMTRRDFIRGGGTTLLGASLAGTLLAGCGGGGASSGEVTYWLALPGGEEYYKKNVEPAFEKAYPNVNLKTTFHSPEDLDRVTRTAIQGGEGPDLVTSPGPSYALELIKADVLLEMDEYSRKHGWKDKALGWALNSGQFEGKQYSVPTTYETMLLYYNETLFEEKGWKPPTNRDELEGVAEEAMGQGIVPFSAGNAEWRPATEWLVTVFFNHYAGPDALHQALTGEIPWTDPVFVDAIDLLNSYFQRGWFGGSVQKYFSNGLDSLHSQLGDGEAAMNMEGSWFMSEVNGFFGKAAGNGNDWNWGALPSLAAGVPFPLFELGIGGTLSINRRAQDPDAAAKYIDWLFSDPDRTAGWMADIPGIFDLPIPLERQDFPASMDERNVGVYASLGNATSEGNFGYVTWTFWPPKSDLFVYEGMEEVMTGKITPAQYCKELDNTFKEERAAGEVPPIISRDSA